MGLLDDAIREHLELKRLRGADPGVVAREEQDALGPVPHRGDAEHEDEAGNNPGSRANDDESFPASYPHPKDATDSVSVGQETVEINMEVELASEDEHDPHSEARRDARLRPVAHPASARAISDESLEWEVPDEEANEPVRHNGPDDEQRPDVGQASDQVEHAEDVLEETPDFLRDTPEQERLWFEQRPPRDFDFNE
jgi:hypothetical protein